jgi:hypothetical protein
LEAHQSRTADLCGRNLSDVEKGGNSELADTKTHYSTADTDDSFMVGIGNLSNSAEENAS